MASYLIALFLWSGIFSRELIENVIIVLLLEAWRIESDIRVGRRRFRCC